MDQPYQQESKPFILEQNTTNSLGFTSNESLFSTINLTPNLSQPYSNESQKVSDSTFSQFWIGNILQAMSIQDDSISKNIATCPCGEGFAAKFFCRDCNENLCEKCVSAHNRVSLTKSHNIVKIQMNDERSSIDDFHKNSLLLSNHVLPFSEEGASKSCKVHANEILDMFCETCLHAICSQCTLNDHKEHRYHFLKASSCLTYPMLSVAKNNLHRLENTVQEVQKTIERVVTKSRTVQSEIHAAVHKHILALKQREVELINKVDQIKLFKCKLLTDQLEQLNSLSNKLKSSMNDINGIMNSGNEVKLLKAKQKFENDIKTCQDTGYVAEDDGIVFVHPNNSILHAFGSFGNVRSSVCAQQSILCKDNGSSGTALCGSSVIFSIHSRDHSGELLHTKPEAFDVTVRKPDNSTFPIDIFDSGAGRFIFQLNPVLEGDYTVSVQCRGVPIQESPYLLKVKHSVTYKSRSLSGAPALVFGKEGDKPGELCRPWGICCSAKGFLVVADRSNNRIQVFNPDGTFHHMFGSSGTRHGQFDRPAGVAIDIQERIIVVDKDNHRVQIFLFDGSFVLAFGEKGSKHGQFNYPWDVAVNKAGIIAVTDTRNHRIQLFTFDGKFISKYGFEGAMWKHFDSPRGVAFTQDDRLIVTDFNNHRLVIINPDMKSARYLGSEGSQTSQFLRPQGVTVDDEGNMIVADSRNHRLQVFTPLGGLIAVFGGARQEDACDPVQMDRPSGVAVTPDGHIAVVDFGNNRVVLF